MSTEVFLALVVYAFVTSVTPGPNNFMLLASGVNFGFFRTIPHILGISAGFASLLVAVGLGLGALLSAYPTLHTALKIAGAAYLLYLAWRIARSRSMGGSGNQTRPMSFLEAAAFQWVNPKAWVLAVTAMAVYTNPAQPFLPVAIVTAAFTLVNLPSVSSWAGFGMALRGFLADPVRLKWFNVAMGVLLAATLWPMLR
jgi:threonine/homoserine/homoserine lactone efflux protein